MPSSSRSATGVLIKGYLASTSFNLPIICVGNLAAGGTGKSPMVELLIRMLKDRYAVAVLSRGYKRKTRGYALADPLDFAPWTSGTSRCSSTANSRMWPSRWGRSESSPFRNCCTTGPETRAIILDDAFQHRAVKAGLKILLTDYSNLFTRDWWLPSGDLRDAPSSYRRADIIIVTKCPETFPRTSAGRSRSRSARCRISRFFLLRSGTDSPIISPGRRRA